MVGSAQLEDVGIIIGLKNSYSDGLHWVDNDPVTMLNFEDGEPSDSYYDQCTGKNVSLLCLCTFSLVLKKNPTKLPNSCFTSRPIHTET